MKNRSTTPSPANAEIREDKIIINDSNTTQVIPVDQAYDRVRELATFNLKQLMESIEKSRKESEHFFKLTYRFSIAGFLLIALGVVFFLAGQVNGGVVSTVGGLLPGIIAALFFKKDKELRESTEKYNKYLIHSHNLLTLIDVADTIQDITEKDKVKREVILRFSNIE